MSPAAAKRSGRRECRELCWLLPSSAARSLRSRWRTSLDDRPRIGSDRAVLRVPVSRLAARVADSGSPGDEGAPPSVPSFGRRARIHRRPDPLPRRAHRRERAPSAAAHRRLARRQTPGLSRPRARPARAAREPISRVAPGPAPGQAQDGPAMAQGRIPSVLAAGIAPARSTRTARRAGGCRPHPPHGDRQPALGSRADSRRALEARRPHREAHSSTVYARLVETDDRLGKHTREQSVAGGFLEASSQYVQLVPKRLRCDVESVPPQDALLPRERDVIEVLVDVNLDREVERVTSAGDGALGARRGLDASAALARVLLLLDLDDAVRNDPRSAFTWPADVRVYCPVRAPLLRGDHGVIPSPRCHVLRANPGARTRLGTIWTTRLGVRLTRQRPRCNPSGRRWTPGGSS